MKQRLILSLLTLLVLRSGYAQNLETIGKNKDITVSGGIAMNSLFYLNNGVNSGRTPLNYFVSGNLNLNLFGVINAPFAFNFSNQNSSFRQPFNQFALHPTYKGATLHLGTTALIFSPYTLSGHRFTGVGAEYQMPNSPLYVGLMVGKLQNAVPNDSSGTSVYNLPAYRRQGWAGKVGYKVLGTQLEATLLKASDDVNSIATPPARYNVLPEDNVAWSLRFVKQLFNRLILQGDYGTTVLTTNKLTENLPDSLRRFNNTLFGLLTPRISTITRHAYRASATYNISRYNIGLEYEHVDPLYRTLGAYYFLNDFENYKANLSGQFLNGKLNLIATAGLQHDNLDRTRLTTLRRFIGLAGLTYTPNERLNLSVNYSNFASYTNLRSDIERLSQVTTYNALDTTNYRQISQNITGSILYNLSSQKDQQKALLVNAVLQTSGDQQGTTTNAKTLFYNASLGYTYGLPVQNFTFNTQLYLSGNQLLGQSIMSWGPYVSVQKTFRKSLVLNGTVGYNQSGSGGASIPAGQVINLRGGLSYLLGKQGQFTLDLIHLRRHYETSFSETTITVGFVQNLPSLRLIGNQPQPVPTLMPQP